MSPFDPMALLDEIQRLVPGYSDVSTARLLGGDEHTTAIESGVGVVEDRPELTRLPPTTRCSPREPSDVSRTR